MKAEKLYGILERDFITPKMSDDWIPQMVGISEFVSDNYKKRSMGLVCDFTDKVERVYTAVFPSNLVLQKVLEDNVENAMVFVHHPAIWDIRQAPNVFQQIDKKLLKKLRERRISVYNLHVPLDNYGKYSTSSTLAEALKIRPKTAFAPYFGALAGVYGKTDLETVQDLRKKFQEAVGHKVSLYNYGNNKIISGNVAVIAGGGNDVEMLEEIAKEGVNTFVTGITVKNDHSRNAHEFAERHKINVLGGTHYSTEKFACIAMVNYFKKLGLDCEFIEDRPVMEDM